jgi:ribonuclease-3
VPEYNVEESGPDHQKSFRATVRVGGRVYGAGEGRSKKEAEQQAAEAAWTAISNGEPPLEVGEGDTGARDTGSGHPRAGRTAGETAGARAASGADGAAGAMHASGDAAAGGFGSDDG